MEPEFGPWVRRGYDKSKTWLKQRGPEAQAALAQRRVRTAIGLGLAAVVSGPALNQAVISEKMPAPVCAPTVCPPELSKLAVKQHIEVTPPARSKPKAQVPKVAPVPSTTSPETKLSITTTTVKRTPAVPHTLATSSYAALVHPLLAANEQVTAYDISHPNCDKPLPTAAFGIVGVNAGLSTNFNPCLKAEASRFQTVELYFNNNITDKPDEAGLQRLHSDCPAPEWSCRDWQIGFLNGQGIANYALSQGIHADVYWADVEVCVGCWDPNTTRNRSVLEGEVDGIKSIAHPQIVGFYSTYRQWLTINGVDHLDPAGHPVGWQVPASPDWVPTGGGSAAQAQAYCQGQSFSGGNVVMTQYGEKYGPGVDDYWDRDWLCPEV